MREEKIQELKNIRASLLEFAKSEGFGRFGVWDRNGKEIGNALKSLAIAIEDSEKISEKRYVGVFYNVNTREEYEIPFYSKYRSGSFMNKNDAWSAKYQYCKENGLQFDDIKLEEAYREKA